MFDELTDLDQGGENKGDVEVSPEADLLKRIVTEDGRQKYASVEEALKALEHAQSFIPELQNENKTYKQELEEIKNKLGEFSNVEEVVERFMSKREEEPTKKEEVAHVDDSSDIESKINEVLSRRDQENSFRSNVTQVTSTLKEHFGDKASEMVAAKMADLGMDKVQIEQLAGTNPKAALALLLPNTSTQTTTTSAESSFNTARFAKPKEEEGIKRPDRSLLAGASSKDQAEFMRQIKESVYKRFGVEG